MKMLTYRMSFQFITDHRFNRSDGLGKAVTKFGAATAKAQSPLDLKCE